MTKLFLLNGIEALEYRSCLFVSLLIHGAMFLSFFTQGNNNECTYKFALQKRICQTDKIEN